MPKLPRPSGKEMLSFLVAHGFSIIRIRGSHHVLAHGEVRTVLPVHANEQLKIGTLRGILRDIRMPADEFASEWQQ